MTSISIHTISVLILISTIKVEFSVGNHLGRHLPWWQNYENSTSTPFGDTTNSVRRKVVGHRYKRDLLNRVNKSALREGNHVNNNLFQGGLIFGNNEKRKQDKKQELKKRQRAVAPYSKNSRDLNESCYIPEPFQEEPDWWIEDPRYSSAVNCDFQENTLVCDYSAATPMLRGLCEAVGGTFYTLTGSMVCPPSILSYTWNTTQLPFCATDCDIHDLIDKGYFAYPDCTNDVNNVVTFDPIVHDTCKAEMSALTYEAGNGNPQWVFDSNTPGECFSNFESLEVDGGGAVKQLCDFKDAMEQMQAPCEEQGGVLYSYSAKIYHLQPFMHGHEMYLNIPVCLGISCDAKPYFEELLTSYYSYSRTVLID